MKVNECESLVETIATTSECGHFRFLIKKSWNKPSKESPHGLFICENPSIADEIRYDQTLANVTTLAANWNWSGFTLVNICPSYSTDPNEVNHDKDAEKINEQYIDLAVYENDLIIVATGVGYKRKINKLIKKYPNKHYLCICKNADGSGRHPSRIDVTEYKAPVKYK